MKAHQLATLVLRLLGIYCLVTLVPMFEMFTSTIFYAGSRAGVAGVSWIVITFLTVVVWLAMGVTLIIFSKPLGQMLTSKTTDDGSLTAVTFEQAQILAFAVAGVLIFAEALPQMFRNVYIVLHYLLQRNNENPAPVFDRPFSLSDALSAVGGLLKAGLGLWLFFRADGFAGFWRSLRNFGTPMPPEN